MKFLILTILLCEVISLNRIIIAGLNQQINNVITNKKIKLFADALRESLLPIFNNNFSIIKYITLSDVDKFYKLSFCMIRATLHGGMRDANLSNECILTSVVALHPSIEGKEPT